MEILGKLIRGYLKNSGEKMIQYLKRKEIDNQKYDDCIKNALNSRIYAYSWYLDIVADNWDALIYKDYEAVMPLPIKKRFLIFQPNWCQQLGLYNKTELNSQEINSIYKQTSRLFLMYYNFNISNSLFKSNRSSIRVNFELPLKNDHATIFKNYRKDRRKSIRKAIESDLKYNDITNINDLISLYKESFPFVDISEIAMKKLSDLINKALEIKHGFQRNIIYKDQIVARGFFLKTEQRIYYLFGASNKLGKQFGATTYLIDSVIKEYAQTELIFDFEGSSIPNVASFYKSFGSTRTEYQTIKQYQGLDILKKIFYKLT